MQILRRTLVRAFGFARLFDFISQVRYFRILGQLAKFLVPGQLIQMQLLTDRAEHLHVFGDFLLREHAELQVQVRPLFGAMHLEFLVHQYERREKYEFDSEDQGEELKRIRIEWWNSNDLLGVHDDPSGEEEKLDKDEAKAAEEPGDDTAHALSRRLLDEYLLFELRDGRYIPFGRRGDGRLR